MPQVSFNQLIKDVNDLPSLPMVTLQVIRLTDDPKTTIPALSNVISQDQAMVAKILRLANSAYYGFARTISSITDAIIILGFKTIRELAFAATVHDIIKKELEGYSLAKGELWKHSIVSAMLARNIAIKTRYKNPEEAFTAGLIHDIGKVVLNLYLTDAFGEVLQKVQKEKIPFMAAEKQILGFDHASVGAQVANKWNLPVALEEAIAYHHNPMIPREDKRLVFIVHLADAICMSMGIGLGADGLMYPFDDGSIKELKLNKEDIEEIIADIAECLVDITSLVDL